MALKKQDFAELKQDIGVAMTRPEGIKLVKKFLKGAGAGYILSCPDADNDRLRRAFHRAAVKLLNVSIPLPVVKSEVVPTKEDFYCAEYSNEAGSPEITWIYFDDLKKGVVCGTFDDRDDTVGYFSLRDYWVRPAKTPAR